MNELLVDRLKTARTEKGLKQQDVAEQLGIKANTISNWEKGRTEPDIDTFVQLCDIYQIDCASLLSEVYAFNRIGTDISLSEYNNIKKYRELDAHGKESVDIVLGRESQRVKSIHEMQTQLSACVAELRKATTPSRIISYYQTLASAGSGEYLFDSIPTDTIEVPITPLSEQADFVIGVKGHSMEPIYNDGEKVYVAIMDEIPTGSIGIFIKGNECFIKELGQEKLISHNKIYPDIPGTDDIKLVGKVLGKVEL